MAVILRADILRHLIRIQQATETQSSTGEVSQTWDISDTRHAWVRPITGKSRERLVGSRLQDEATHMVTMRYVADLTGKDRILFKTRTFEILDYVDVEEMNVRHELICKELR